MATHFIYLLRRPCVHFKKRVHCLSSHLLGIFFSILLFCLFYTSGFSQIPEASLFYLTEVMADPSILPDIEGEFIEILSTASIDTLYVIQGNDTLRLFHFPAWEPSVICRDSIAMRALSVNCFANWPSLSLSNSRSDTITLVQKNSFHSVQTIVPVSQSGKSMEAIYTKQNTDAEWKPSTQSWQGSDLATPGQLPPNFPILPPGDFSLDSASILSSTEIKVCVSENPSQTFATHTSTTITKSFDLLMDSDWNHTPETHLGSAITTLALQPNPSLSLALYCGKVSLPTASLMFHTSLDIILEEDIYTGNNQKHLWKFGKTPLRITEVCPVGDSIHTEWIKITNSSPQNLFLNDVKFQNAILQPTQTSIAISAGSSVTFAEATSSYLAPYTPHVLSPWPTLSNRGDTLTLAIDTTIIDQLIYPSQAVAAGNAKNEAHCFFRPFDSEIISTRIASESPSNTYPSTNPSLTDTEPHQFAFQTSGKVFDARSENALWKISIESPSHQSYTIAVYDETGYAIRTLCSPCYGSRVLYWDGTTDRQQLAPIGPLLLSIKHPDRKVQYPFVYLRNP